MKQPDERELQRRERVVAWILQYGNRNVPIFPTTTSVQTRKPRPLTATERQEMRHWLRDQRPALANATETTKRMTNP